MPDTAHVRLNYQEWATTGESMRARGDAFDRWLAAHDREVAELAKTETSDHASGLMTIADEVAAERARQDARWGEQNHPDGTGPRIRWGFLGVNAREGAAAARDWCNTHHGRGEGTWLDILLEEVAEAFAESDPARLRAELVQVAAVAQQWCDAIDRRNGGA
jgi:hypothetical protein